MPFKVSLKRKAASLFCKGQQAHCTLLQETQSEASDVKFWSQQWGHKILFSHGLESPSGFTDLSIKADEDRHWVACILEVDNVPIILLNIYGCNNDQYNRNLLHMITTVITEFTANFPMDHIIVGGDFNLAPDESTAFTAVRRN